MDDLLDEFAQELREGYALLLPHLAAWRDAPQDQALLDAIFRYVHSAKGGAGFVRMARIEAIATAIETALEDLRHWDLAEDTPQVGLVIEALARVNAIAEAMQVGIGLPALGEDALIETLSAGRNVLASGSDPAHVQPIGTLRLPGPLVDQVIAASARLAADTMALCDCPTPAALARLRDDARAQFETLKSIKYAPLTDLLCGLETYVGALAASAERHVVLTARARDIVVDRRALPVLRTALCHLLRNAVSHGIESPEARTARGKPAHGTIEINAIARADRIDIDVSDDGGGVNYAALAEFAEIQAYANDDILSLIQLPGVTAAQNVSALAGHGVGLDCVRIAIERLDGSLQLFDRPQLGFTARLSIPETGVCGDG